MVVSAYSSKIHSGTVSDSKERNRIGWSAGFTLRNVGGVGMPAGRRAAACVMAVCTSRAAPSRSRLRLNWSVICVEPMAFVDVIESNPAIVENCRSSGVATAEDMVSGLAPGRLAETKIVGTSTVGRTQTPSIRYALAANSAMAAQKCVGGTRRRIKSSDIFTTKLPRQPELNLI